MCSLYSLLRMENYQGDLTDILRAGATGAAYGVSEPLISSTSTSSPSDWQFIPSSSSSDPINFLSSMEDQPRDNFGDPFSHVRDPLLHELGIPGPGLYSSSSGIVVDQTGTCTFGASGSHSGSRSGSGSVSGSGLLAQSGVDDDMKRPAAATASSNIFSRMLQISPSAKLPASQCDSPASARGIKASGLVGSDMINVSSSKGCLVDNSTTGVQISSPRNPGIKRRKSQAKQVVCIPAPAAPNSRPSGEIVPSDLWAWRKYGQKPIKGSPYPRGYYRCSSSKGCSARKQVERSRADPNMLVITYTSEHNHPWPTQRNALAGSTRSQPTKNNATSKSSPSCSHHQLQKTSSSSSTKEDQRDTNENNNSTPSASIKEEMEEMEKQLELVDDGEFSTDHHRRHHHHHQGFPYRPSMPPDTNHSDQDFFADLGEIEADPLNLLFSQSFAADHEHKGSKGLDPFNLFDWSADNNNNSAFGEAKRGL